MSKENTTRINNLKTNQKIWSSKRVGIFEKLSTVKVLEDFLKTAIDKGEEAAIAGLPQDDPGTTYIDESITLEDISQQYSEFFDGQQWTMEQALNELESKYSEVHKEVLQLLGNTVFIDMEISKLSSQIKDIQNIDIAYSS